MEYKELMISQTSAPFPHESIPKRVFSNSLIELLLEQTVG